MLLFEFESILCFRCLRNYFFFFFFFQEFEKFSWNSVNWISCMEKQQNYSVSTIHERLEHCDYLFNELEKLCPCSFSIFIERKIGNWLIRFCHQIFNHHWSFPISTILGFQRGKKLYPVYSMMFQPFALMTCLSLIFIPFLAAYRWKWQ